MVTWNHADPLSAMGHAIDISRLTRDIEWKKADGRK
jgi:hypothetical protein